MDRINSKIIKVAGNFSLLAAALQLSACKQNYDIDVLKNEPIEDSFQATGQPPTDKVDVLFVVDTSGSMTTKVPDGSGIPANYRTKKEIVNDSMDAFIDNFATRNIDYQIGMISTDGRSDADTWGAGGFYASFSQNAYPGSLMAHFNNSRILTPELNTATDPMDPLSHVVQDQLKDNVTSLTTDGSGAEMALYSTSKFFDSHNTAWNQGFVRQNSILSVVIISDEDESEFPEANQNPRGYEPYIRVKPAKKAQREQEFITKLRNAKNGRSGLIRVDAVTSLQGVCPEAAVEKENGVPGYGIVYEEVAKLMGGKAIDICTDFATDLGHLGADIAGVIERRFTLTRRPTPNKELEVLLNGQPIPEDGQNGYTFSELSNEITLNGLNLESLGSYTLKVKYLSPAGELGRL